MNGFVGIVLRDLRLAWGRGGIVLPLVFFLLVATLFPFGVGPDAALLAKTGGGVVWIAALLSALLPIDRLIAPDVESGVLDQLAVRGIGDEGVALAKLIAHWTSFGPPLMLATIIAAGLLRLDGQTLWKLEIGLLLGTPALAALSLTTAALTAGLRGGSGAIGGLLMLPLAIPVLIFGAGSLGPSSAGAFKLLAALSLLFVAATPFATGASIKALRE